MGGIDEIQSGIERVAKERPVVLGVGEPVRAQADPAHDQIADRDCPFRDAHLSLGAPSGGCETVPPPRPVSDITACMRAGSKFTVLGITAVATLALAGNAQAATSTDISSYDDVEFGDTGFHVGFGQVFSSKDSCSANRKVKLVTEKSGKTKLLDVGVTSAEGAISGGYLKSRVGNAQIGFVAPKTKECDSASVRRQAGRLDRKADGEGDQHRNRGLRAQREGKGRRLRRSDPPLAREPRSCEAETRRSRIASPIARRRSTGTAISSTTARPRTTAPGPCT